MSNDQSPLPDSVPFAIEKLDSQRVVVRFNTYVDHRRIRPLEEQLENTVRTFLKIACDVQASEAIDSDWLTLLDELSLEAKQAGKRMVLVGLSESLKKSADIVGLHSLEHVSTLQEAWT